MIIELTGELTGELAGIKAFIKAFFLTIALQLSQFAYADAAEPLVSRLPVLPGTQHLISPRIDYRSNDFFPNKENVGSAESIFRNQVDEPQGTLHPANDTAPRGLHWTVDNQRPALGYRFSEQGVIRFHVGRHGATAAAWSF